MADGEFCLEAENKHKGFGTAMMHGAIRRCQELSVEKCYVNSFGQRKDFYKAAGFSTENATGFWYKVLNKQLQTPEPGT